ncbi:EF-hand domain-containing protein [Roseovarius phycicola]|uniref:Calcium-binding protein n=1 Tax=Roseovarius phycicola TaxID=3080976 RepID=A0ABZ2HKH9_9RHOB
MKNSVLIGALGVSIVLGGTAQSLAAPEGYGPRHSFETLDADKDGQVTQAEFDAHRAERFAKADTNSDGLLSRDEILAKGQQRAERFADRMFKRLDENRDGAISLAEMSEGRGNRFFDRADSDGDGAVSEAEFDKMKARMIERHTSRQKDQE